MEGGRKENKRGRLGGREGSLVWIGLDWTGLVNELYCSRSGSLAERDGEEEKGLSFFFPPFFLFSFFFANMKREERFTCVDLFCAFFSLALLHRHHSHHHRTNTDGIGETYVANQQIGCVSESERCERIFLFSFTSLLSLPRYTYPPPLPIPKILPS